jgi:hypothetical protein
MVQGHPRRTAVAPPRGRDLIRVLRFHTDLGQLATPATLWALADHRLSPQSVTMQGLDEGATETEDSFEVIHRALYDPSASRPGTELDFPPKFITDEDVELVRVLTAPEGVKAVLGSPREVVIAPAENAPEVIDGVVEVETTAKGAILVADRRRPLRATGLPTLKSRFRQRLDQGFRSDVARGAPWEVLQR